MTISSGVPLLRRIMLADPAATANFRSLCCVNIILGERDRMADEIKYEYKSVRTVRGTDGLVISKMRKDGWEVVGQDPGTLTSTVKFRRPKKPVPWLLIGAG